VPVRGAASGPYGVCIGIAISRVRHWIVRRSPEDLTLFVFEEGDVSRQDVRRILTAEGVDGGQPPQFWPRQWRDECGRTRHLRPFEACDLLAVESDGDVLDPLRRGSWHEREVVDRERLLGICRTIRIERRAAAPRGSNSMSAQL
jgi:hypothetical protein